jgi:GTP cyclohydrolase I
MGDALFEATSDETVIVRDIEFFSLCEHHLLPFFGRVHVAYLPNGKVVGLSKVPRLVEMYARRLQMQERLTQQIADALMSTTGALGVAVVIQSSHMCAMMRGVEQAQLKMETHAFRGQLKENESRRHEITRRLCDRG